jgi:hypothetical protein
MNLRIVGTGAKRSGALFAGLLTIGLLGGSVGVASLPAADLSSERSGQDVSRLKSCGPLALQTAMTLLGRSAELIQCADLAGADDSGTTSLAGLLNAAKAMGVRAVGMRLSPEELARLNRPAILHVSLASTDNHFVVFASGHDGWYEVIDPTQGEHESLYSAEQLRLMWEGDCLVFTDRPLVAALVCGTHRSRNIVAVVLGVTVGIVCALAALRLPYVGRSLCRFLPGTASGLTSCSLAVLAAVATLIAVGAGYSAGPGHGSRDHDVIVGASRLDLGELEWGQVFSTSVWIGNAGHKTLDPNKVKVVTSCRCIRARVSEEEILPDQKGKLKLRLGPLKEIGPFRYSVTLLPDGGSTGPSVLTLQGRVSGPGGIAYPPRLYFGRVGDPSSAQKTIAYVLLKPDTRIVDVTSSIPQVKCTFARRDTRTFLITVSVTALPAAGPFEGTITIATNDPHTKEIKVPFSGVAEPLGEVSFLGGRRPGGIAICF